jgi:hypothetical protein
MTVDPMTAALLSAVGALATAVIALWRRIEALHSARRADQAKASQLIFALLQQRRDDRGEAPPPTLSDWDDEPTTAVTEGRFLEATVHAKTELNGDVEQLVKKYLSSTPTPMVKAP